MFKRKYGRATNPYWQSRQVPGQPFVPPSEEVMEAMRKAYAECVR